LDNTLWGGIIGEDGLGGIKLGPGSPVGEAHADLQAYLLELRRRGILLAVCSKNNEDDAKLPFLQHPYSRLHLEDFSAFVANWDDKAVNIRYIAGQLSLGTDSFVFLDDNPVERAWIRSQFPEVAVVDTGSSVFGYLEALDRGRYFYVLQAFQDDVARADRYRIQAAVTTLRQGSESAEAFLQSLQMTAITTRITPENISRVTQLLNKTNQFNLTTRRHTEKDLLQMQQQGASITTFSYRDAFGPQGLISVVAICKNSDCVQIDSWLMSCRVLNRTVEQAVLAWIVAEANGLPIIGEFIPTQKNGLVRDLYQRFGFQLVARDAETKAELWRYQESESRLTQHYVNLHKAA
jgi:FkbH-like protein